MMKRAMIAAVAVAAIVSLAAPANADDEAFNRDLTAAEIPANGHLTLQMWADAVCQMAARFNLSDAYVLRYLPGDVASHVTLTPQQAAIVWASAKRNIC